MTEEQERILRLREEDWHCLRRLAPDGIDDAKLAEKVLGAYFRDLELAPPKDATDENKRLRAVLKEIEARMEFCETKCGIPVDFIMRTAGLEYLSEEKKETSR